MKNLLLISLLIILVVSCEYTPTKYPIYRLSTVKMVPDSLKDDQAKFIVETMRAASNNLTTSDYEDVDDAIEEAQESSEKIFSIEVRCLERLDNSSEYWQTILPNFMSENEKKIFNELINK